ncbi:MAG: triose-phosphate isomerase, partial [Christensenella sp.]
GRGLSNILPESLKAAGAQGVMLNHIECPIGLAALYKTILRARELKMMTIVCADSIPETKAVASLGPDLMVTEPAELIATKCAADISYVKTSVDTIMSIDSNIGILVGGGINCGKDVYDVIAAGADATGSSSAIATAHDPKVIVEEMLNAVREAWNFRNCNSLGEYKK